MGASAYMDYIPYQGLGTACSQQQAQNKSPTHSSCVDQPLGRQPQSISTAHVGGLHLRFPVIWSHFIWAKCPWFRSADSGREVKIGGQDGGTKGKWRDRVSQEEGKQRGNTVRWEKEKKGRWWTVVTRQKQVEKRCGQVPTQQSCS